ncbi:dihydrolipoamide acetyltransferase family protein [Nocardia aurea]|uniref:Dihydrolipoamide acetyltransferase component of pyruvate dehydrogenase complex n=1 Tax=Nocardia aurea TaxID=2144174 RepID=A0ABV3FR58_9NOCA
MTTTVVALADVGEGIADAVVLEWKVAPGDPVHTNQTLLEIETVKAIVEVPAPCDGVVVALEAEEGETVPVGAPLLTIAHTDSVPSPSESSPSESSPSESSPSESSAPPSSELSPSVPSPTVPSTRSSNGSLAKPNVRRLARELGIDLTEVTGTGQHGRITEEDLAVHRSSHDGGSSASSASDREEGGVIGQDRAARVGHTSGKPGLGRERPPSAGLEQADPNVGDAVVPAGSTHPVSPVRRATAEAVSASFFSAPHATVFLESDATGTVELVDRYRADSRFRPAGVTASAVVAAAVSIAAIEVPEINSAWDGVSEVITRYHAVNLGIAVATDRGLLVPNIVDAQRLSIIELAEAIGDLVSRARAGKLTPAEFTGGTITISNVGSLGIDTATPIVNRGESAILCVGAIAKRPRVVDDAVVARWTVPLSLSFDHRLIDGDTAARALVRIAAILRDPLWHIPIGVTPPR